RGTRTVRSDVARRLPAERRVGDEQHSAPPLGLELYAGCQVGKQGSVRVVDGDDYRVRHDILREVRQPANLRDPTAELATGKRGDAEADSLADVNPADVGLVDRGPDLHPAQVAGNKENTGPLAGHDGLPDMHSPIEDNAFDGRPDRGVAKVD